jgi:hypothetical protein
MLVVGLVALCATPAYAERYYCALAANSETAWMPPVITIDYNRAAASATVAHGWQEGPAIHQASVDATPARFTFSVTNPARINSRTVQLHYRMTYRFAQRALTVSIVPGAGFQGHVRGTYGCSDA